MGGLISRNRKKGEPKGHAGQGVARAGSGATLQPEGPAKGGSFKQMVRSASTKAMAVLDGGAEAAEATAQRRYLHSPFEAPKVADTEELRFGSRGGPKRAQPPQGSSWHSMRGPEMASTLSSPVRSRMGPATASLGSPPRTRSSLDTDQISKARHSMTGQNPSGRKFASLNQLSASEGEDDENYPGHAAVAQSCKGSPIRRRLRKKQQMAQFSSTAKNVGLIR